MALQSKYVDSTPEQSYIAICRRRRPKSSESSTNKPAAGNLIDDQLCNRDFCEHMTTNRSEFANIDTFHTPERLRSLHPSIRHAGSKPGSGESGSNYNRPNSSISNALPDPPVVIEPTSRRRFHHNFWSTLRNAFGIFSSTRRIGHQISVIENVPRNTISNLVKMIFLPLLLLVIAVAMVPSIKELANQTFNSIFYNAKLPETRIATLKRISVGISLIFEHVIKTVFPVVRLRWMNRKLFKRREPVLAPIPSVVPPL